MRLVLFGAIRDSAPQLHDTEIEAACATVGDLLAWIAVHEPELHIALTRTRARYAVDQRFVDSDAKIGAASEVALMSPLSGG